VVKRSDICPQADAGFTLIELVVAIAIVGLGLTFVLPRLTGWFDRLAFSLQQERVEETLAELGLKARRSGRTVFLRSTSLGPNPTEQAPVELPANWTLTVEPPIAFRYDGVCTGGTVRLSFPTGDKTYRLLAPYCRLDPL
jgi:prepilin-type N-terminal cleavage/methylation domain-containing protein